MKRGLQASETDVHPLDGPNRSRVARLADGKWQVIFRGLAVHHPFETEDAAWHFLMSCRMDAVAKSQSVRLRVTSPWHVSVELVQRTTSEPPPPSPTPLSPTLRSC